MYVITFIKKAVWYIYDIYSLYNRFDRGISKICSVTEVETERSGDRIIRCKYRNKPIQMGSSQVSADFWWLSTEFDHVGLIYLLICTVPHDSSKDGSQLNNNNKILKYLFESTKLNKIVLSQLLKDTYLRKLNFKQESLRYKLLYIL